MVVVLETYLFKRAFPGRCLSFFFSEMHCPIQQGRGVRSFSDAAGGGKAKQLGAARKSKQTNARGPVTWQSVGMLVFPLCNLRSCRQRYSHQPCETKYLPLNYL